MFFSHFSRKIWSQFLIILGLLLFIFLPRPLLGKWYLEKANEFNSIGMNVKAEIYYENAAMRCWWENGLYDKAANAALEADDDEGAIRLFEIALQEGELTDQGLLSLGELYYQKDEIDLAFNTWNKISIDSEFASSGLFIKAAALQESGQFSSAMKSWQQGLILDPQNGQAHYNLGLLLMVVDPIKAVEEFKQAITYEQNLANIASEYISSLQEIVELDDLAYQLILAGKALAAKDEWLLADQAFMNSTKQNPLYAEAWAWLGESAQHLDKDPWPFLKKSFELDPESLTSLVLTGLYYRRQGQVDLAWDSYSKAVRLEPGNFAWQVILGELSAEKGNLPDALDYLSQAVNLSPINPDTWRALVQFSVQYQIYTDTVGLDAARQLLVLEPDNWESYDDMGQVMLVTDNFNQAKYYFERSVELDPNQAEPHLHLGSLYLLLNMYQNSRLEFERAISLAPDSQAGQQARRLLDQYFP